jgi:hypothetical protein
LKQLPPGGPPSLPKIEHTSPPQIITVHQPLMKPQLQNYNEMQKRKLNALVNIKVGVADKKSKLTNFPGTANDLNYKKVAHLFRVLDKLSSEERKKLREVLGKTLNRDIPILKSK